MARRAVRLVLLCALILQGLFPSVVRLAAAEANGPTCMAADLDQRPGGSRHEQSHDDCCTLACAACCTIVAALHSCALVLPPRRPAEIGLLVDEPPTPGRPYDLVFAARGPPAR